ncbi:MAG TPA: TauD/TfdA family dioxygenase [Blastocatellia bacterium]|jgi:alpha-ketoglutarate-dependent taurine dioxygenase|nr:TauD/TfdA family dioxygenase [Blastocatellia bacterium]
MKDLRIDGQAEKSPWASRRKNLSPKVISVTPESLIRTGSLPGGGPLPLLVEPALEGVALAAWARQNLDFIEGALLANGGILFRGFGLKGQEDLAAFLESIALRKMFYMEGATPRTELGDKIYTSTEYPSQESIALHNELNYVITWPMKIIFYCVTPAATGGETPIADVRNVLRRISPETAERFREKGWMLVRNFGGGMSLPWQTAFRKQTREELEEYCRASFIECQWKEGDRLRTRQVRPAIRNHPKTGEPVWFNHVAFWHISSLRPEVRKMFLSEFEQDDLPYNAYYGDGSTIEDEVAQEIRAAYRDETVAFAWQKGDLLLLDNMLVAHGRNPFTGERKILTSMGEPFNGQDYRYITL